MASGGDEPVADGGPDGHSVFAEALIRALQETDKDTYTGVDLFYGYLRQRVAGNSSQVPQYVPIRDSGHDDGDFVFIRKAGTAPAATFNVAEAWAKSKALTDANRWEEAFPILQQVCNAGDPRGCMNLGLAYSNGAGVARDRNRSAELFRQACAAKNPVGCNALGYSYANGMGVEKDLVRAAQLYRESCDGGVAIGCYHLALSYENGLGLEKDPVRAAEFYRQACDGKKANACANVGRLYSTGTGVAKNLAESAKFYGFGCNLDDSRSCHELSIAYSSGLGVAKDQVEADRLLRKACGLGWNGCSVTEPQ
jgi:TPR repeat protein